MLASDPEPRAPADDMAARRISDNVVLVAYSAGDSRRSSLWVRGADGWRLLFHQGTSTRCRRLRFALRGPHSISPRPTAPGGPRVAGPPAPQLAVRAFADPSARAPG